MTSLLTSPAPVEPASESPADAVVGALISGRSAVVSGPAGIGKSWTLHVAAARLRTSERSVLGLRSTSSLAAVPFGALLPLLATCDPPAPRTRTETALALLSSLARTGDAVLIVDDAHLLDAASAGLLHQAALGGRPVAVAVRDGEVVPDAISRLVSDLGAVDVVVPRLTEADTAMILAEVLGGGVDHVLTRTVHYRSSGLPLAVLALARVARTSGAVTLVRGEWRLRAPIPVSDELATLMRSSTAGLDDGARRAAELVALAEALTETQVRALDADDGAERAESQGVLAVSRTGVLSLAHPLHLDALLADMPDLRRRRRLGELVEALGDGGSVVDRLRRVEWRLELGSRVESTELLELVDVTAADDPERAERFARAAIAVGGGVAARLRLAEVLAHLHRADEAEQVLAAIDPSALDKDTIMLAELTKAFLLVFALARPDDALEVLLPLPDAPIVLALRSTAHYNAGRLARAEAESAAVAEQPALPIEARAHAALTRATTLAFLGEHDRFRAWLPVAGALIDDAVAAIPEGKESIRLLEGLEALRTMVDPAAAERLAGAGYRGALSRGDDGERSQWTHQLGEAALLRGDAETAVELLRRAARGRGRWAISTVGWVRGTLVRALALAGEHGEAQRELVELRTLRIIPILLTDVALAEAELAASELDLKRAGRLADEAARSRVAGSVDAWYAAMRFGRAGAATAFLAASERLAGPGRLAQRRHAEAVLAHDATALEAASAALAAAGLGWFAIDAMAHAAQAFARADPADGAPRERLRRLTASHPSLRSPLVAALDGPVLTEREAQIARLVVEGATARGIAEQLGVGVRTIETHVAHAYRKLGVASRDELRGALLAR